MKKDKTLREEIEEILREKILYIGNEIPENFTTDKRSKQLYLGYPQEFIDKLEALFKEEIEKVIGAKEQNKLSETNYEQIKGKS